MKRWLVTSLAPRLGALFIKSIGESIRLRVHDPYQVLVKKDRPAVLFSFWHNRLFLLPYLQQRLIPHRRLAAMISRSKDGNLISDIARQFGLDSARGSSSRRGSAALLALAHWLEEGIDSAITPDGPRGPRQQVQPGILFLARSTGHSIIPLRLDISHKIELGSWDRFQIPLPFAKCDIYFQKPIFIPADADDAAMERFSTELAQAMGE